MNLFEWAIVGTVCTAKEDIRYKNRYPHFVTKGAHFQITDADRRGVHAFTGSIKIDEFWTWRQLAEMLITPRGVDAWNIRLPKHPVHLPYLQRVRARMSATAGRI